MSQPTLWSRSFFERVNPHVLQVGFHKAVPGWLSPRYGIVQQDFDLWYVAGGMGDVMIDGRWHAFEAGDLVTILPGQCYDRERTGPDPFQIYWTHLLPMGAGPGVHRLHAALARAWPRRLSLRHRPETAALFNRYYEAYLVHPEPHSPALRGLSLQVLDIVFDEIRRPALPAPPRSYASLLRAKAFIESSYAGTVTLAQIARAADLSPSHLSALFHRHMGVAPVEFLLQVRIREAKRLLAEGRRAKHVAFAVGCQSAHYFSRLFKKKVGMSPTQFARRFQR